MAGWGDRIYRAYGTIWCVLSLPSSFTWHRPTPFIEDCAAFLVIVFSARKRGHMHAAGVPSLLECIVKDATIYFLVVFGGQLLVIFFDLLAPVSGLSTDSLSSAHLIMAAHRYRSKRSLRGKLSPSTSR